MHTDTSLIAQMPTTLPLSPRPSEVRKNHRCGAPAFRRVVRSCKGQELYWGKPASRSWHGNYGQKMSVQNRTAYISECFDSMELVAMFHLLHSLGVVGKFMVRGKVVNLGTANLIADRPEPRYPIARCIASLCFYLAATICKQYTYPTSGRRRQRRQQVHVPGGKPTIHSRDNARRSSRNHYNAIETSQKLVAQAPSANTVTQYDSRESRFTNSTAIGVFMAKKYH